VSDEPIKIGKGAKLCNRAVDVGTLCIMLNESTNKLVCPEKIKIHTPNPKPFFKASDLNPVFEEVTPKFNKKECPTKFRFEVLNKDFELEQLCKAANGFIIGYADIVVKFDVKLIWDIIIDGDSWIWKEFQTKKRTCLLIIECKPTLKTWAGPLRQLKTYMDILTRECRFFQYWGLISTFSEVSPEVESLLRNEHVFVKTLSENQKTKKLQ